MQAIRQSVSRMALATGRRTYKAPAYHRQVTMNDMPVPQGDFFELEAQRMRKYNAILGTGILLCTIAFGIYFQTDLIQMHYTPPKSLD